MTFDLQTPASQFADALGRALSRITGVPLPTPIPAAAAAVPSIPEPINTQHVPSHSHGAPESARPTSSKDRPTSSKDKKDKDKDKKEKDKDKDKKDKRKSQVPTMRNAGEYNSASGIPGPMGGATSSAPINESPEEAMRRKRREAAREIYTSEEAYVKSLNEMISLWKTPMKSKGIVTDSECSVLFGNIETLVQINTVLLNEVKVRMEIWTDSTKVGDVFVKNSMYLRAYKSYYETYNDAQNILQALAKKKSYTQFAKGAESSTTPLHGQHATLDKLLTLPFQRVPRYLMLLREVLNKTPAEHPDHAELQEALNQIAGVASELEKGIADAQFAKRLQAVISRNYIGLSPLLVPHRILHTEGEIEVSVQGTLKANVALLFNDVIAFVLDTPKEKRVVSHTAFDTLWLIDLPSEMSSNANAFELHTPEIVYRCTSKDKATRDRFYEDIDKQILTDLTLKGALLEKPSDRASDVSSTPEGIPPPLTTARTDVVSKNQTSERIRVASYTWEHGGSYKGEWVNAKMHGKGVRVSPNGSMFEGAFVKGVLHGHGTATYKSGDAYTGEWARDVPHGKGTLTIKTMLGQKSYVGDWETGRKKGLGTMVWENGDVFEGGWENDLFHGKGTLTKKDNSRYEGDWFHGQRHGQRGVYAGPLGEKYDGAWDANLKHGKGSFTYPDGSTYAGDFVADQRQGTGVYMMIEGMRYEGEFMANLFNGHGTLSEINTSGQLSGDSYAGAWRNGRRHGIGTLTKGSGEKYEGAWVEDRKHGKGTHILRSGLTYDGEWKEDKKHGQGTVTRPDGSSYAGEWAMDRRDGRGSEKWPNGASYDGYFKTDVRHGQGSFTWPDGSVYMGSWNLGKRSGKGIMKTSAGTYDGDWKEDLRDGHGTWTSSDGSTYSGEWTADRRNGKGLLNNISEQIWKDGLIIKPGVQHFAPDLPAPFYFN